jgi:fructose-1-phosphate kinase PfkB-like protein
VNLRSLAMADIITLTPNPAVDLSTSTERIVPTM